MFVKVEITWPVSVSHTCMDSHAAMHNMQHVATSHKHHHAPASHSPPQQTCSSSSHCIEQQATTLAANLTSRPLCLGMQVAGVAAMGGVVDAAAQEGGGFSVRAGADGRARQAGRRRLPPSLAPVRDSRRVLLDSAAIKPERTCLLHERACLLLRILHSECLRCFGIGRSRTPRTSGGTSPRSAAPSVLCAPGLRISAG